MVEYTFVEGVIEKVKTHPKVIKIDVCKFEEGGTNLPQSLMIFKTDYVSICKSFIENLTKSKKPDYDHHQMARLHTIAANLPVFLVGSQLRAYCSMYKDSLCIKQFWLESPDLEEKPRCISWIKDFEKWLVTFMWKFGQKQNNKFRVIDEDEDESNQQNIPMAYIASTRSTLNSVLKKPQLGTKDHTSLIKILQNETDSIVPNDCNVFWVLDQFFERMKKFKNIKADISKKSKELGYEIFTNTELVKILEFCDDYECFKENPYSNYKKMNRFNNSFVLLDKFAALGDVDIKKRVDANLIFIMQDVMNSEGHTCFPFKTLVLLIQDHMQKFLLTTRQKNEFASLNLEDIIKTHEDFYIYYHEDNQWVYLKNTWECESYIIQRIREFIQNRTERSQDVCQRVESLIKDFEKKTAIQLNTRQIKAVQNTLCTKTGINILTGFPGTGKSRVISCIEYICQELSLDLILCAPTGKAANRLGTNASTIHRLLEAHVRDEKQGFVFMKNENTPLKTDVLIIDESSMIDFMICFHLLKACPKEISILFVGDQHQLPSVGFGDVFHSFIASQLIPFVSLNKIYRQDHGSNICLLSKCVTKGILPSYDIINDQKETYFKNIPTSKSSEIFQEILKLYRSYGNDSIILSPMRKGTLGSFALNQYLHNNLFSLDNSNDFYFKANERIMVSSNTYKKDSHGLLDVGKSAFNGEIGYFVDTECDKDGQRVCKVLIDNGGFQSQSQNDKKEVTLERQTLELGHACTIHKMQGAEIPIVILVLSLHHGRMLNKRLLYTAITRAKKKIFIIGDESAVIKSVLSEGEPRFECIQYRMRENI